MDLISSVNTTASKEGWLEINITSAFMEWLNSPEGNNGLYMAVHLHTKPGKVLLNILNFDMDF